MEELALERAALTNQQLEARKTSKRGLALVAGMPLALIAALASVLIGGPFMWLVGIASLIYMLVGGIAGGVMVIAGSVEHRNLARRLEALDEARMLPEARVVVRRP